GLLSEQDPEATKLVAEMAREQHEVLKHCPDRWLGDCSFPSFPTAHSSALYQIVEAHRFIDSLSIKGVLTTEILEQVASIPYLLSLRLTDDRFRADLSSLQGCSIERLSLATINPKRSPLDSLGDLTQLCGLTLESQRLNPSLATSIARLGVLESLKLTIHNGKLGALRYLDHSKLQDLQVNARRLGDDDLKILGDCGGLTDLDIGAGQFSQSGLDDLCRAKSLARLCFSDHRSLGQLELSGLTQLRRLESLYLQRCRFRESQMDLLSKLPNLKAISITQNSQVGDRIFDFVKDLEKLESLDLSGTCISDAGVAKLAGLNSLQVLFLGDSPITVEGLKALSALPQLELLLWDHHVYFRATEPPLSEYLDRLGEAS
ncbi:MAG: hypothetical protein P1V97_28515, partial [Planctomycetota bacterium]|nr:hypothetical protein [Planctomycetota bacterium]